MLGDWTSTCLPGEFERQSAIILGFNELLPFYPKTAVDIVRALIDRLPIITIVFDEEQRRSVITTLCDWGVPAHLIYFVSFPVKGMWVRDYGPSFVRRSDGSVTILDAEYALQDRPNDDRTPSALAALLRLRVVQVPLAIEGGNLLSNGQGTCLTSTRLLDRNQHHNYSPQKIQQILEEYYGFYQGASFYALNGEHTGHADMFATWVSHDTVVVGEYDPAMDRVNAAILEKNVEMVRGLRTRTGPVRVRRIPMPSNKDGVWRTYTNVIYANGALLVPSYPDQDRKIEEQAHNLYRELLPDWEIIPIDVSGLIQSRGALRCVSINVPWLEDRFVPTAAKPGQVSDDALDLAMPRRA